VFFAVARTGRGEEGRHSAAHRRRRRHRLLVEAKCPLANTPSHSFLPKLSAEALKNDRADQPHDQEVGKTSSLFRRLRRAQRRCQRSGRARHAFSAVERGLARLGRSGAAPSPTAC
jgi:hypothetical protein